MKLLTLPAAFLALSVLSACDPDEQDRILYHEPGTYQGKSDSELSQEQVRELQSRVELQGR
ncbi:hypothetical protein ACFOW6_08410 [Fodinicurvata halophila]|uniref:Lipoprotein n=1 Tax=Fodinicurvata halophila TaxID=1419723 RepID=A0ABV8UK16_9PROT